jgi:hypothetical protein
MNRGISVKKIEKFKRIQLNVTIIQIALKNIRAFSSIKQEYEKVKSLPDVNNILEHLRDRASQFARIDSLSASCIYLSLDDTDKDIKKANQKISELNAIWSKKLEEISRKYPQLLNPNANANATSAPRKRTPLVVSVTSQMMKEVLSRDTQVSKDTKECKIITTTVMKSTCSENFCKIAIKNGILKLLSANGINIVDFIFDSMQEVDTYWVNMVKTESKKILVSNEISIDRVNFLVREALEHIMKDIIRIETGKILFAKGIHHEMSERVVEYIYEARKMMILELIAATAAAATASSMTLKRKRHDVSGELAYNVIRSDRRNRSMLPILDSLRASHTA